MKARMSTRCLSGHRFRGHADEINFVGGRKINTEVHKAYEEYLKIVHVETLMIFILGLEAGKHRIKA